MHQINFQIFKTSPDLWLFNSDKKAIIEKQLHLQVEHNKIHENIREVPLRNQTNTGSSDYNRRMLLVFISLLEILELALSTSFDHDKLNQKFSNHPKVLETYQNLANNLASSLKELSKSIGNKKKYITKHELFEDLNALELAIIDYENDLKKKGSFRRSFHPYDHVTIC